MASRRRSVMPPAKAEAPGPSAASRRASIQVMRPPVGVVKPLAKVPSRTVVSKPNPGPKSAKTSAAPAMKTDDGFISGASFDFKQVDSPAGPMTRARRSSIYHKPSTIVKRATVATIKEETVITPASTVTEKIKPTAKAPKSAAKPKIESPVQESPKFSKDVEAKTPNSGKQLLAKTPILRIAKLETPKNSSSSPIRVVRSARRRTPARSVTKKTPARTATMKTPAPPKLSSMEEEATEDEKPMKIAEPQKSVKKSTTSALLKEISASTQRPFTSINNIKNIQSTFTPQAADPQKLLRRNLKTKVENQIDTKVLNLPKGSPYTLMRGFTENGSPAEELVKLTVRPSKGAAVQFMTATPAPKRLLRSSKVDKEQRDVAVPSMKRKLSLSFDDDDNENVEPKKLKTEVVAATVQTHFEENHLVTGGLGKLCAIM